jgi:hypothetical protein
MKYKIIPLLFLFFNLNTYSQNKYSFDYMMEYGFQRTETSKVEKIYLLTNSKDDSYSARLSQSKSQSLGFDVYFRDDSGFTSEVIIDKVDFFKAQSITLPCENLRFYKARDKKYDSDRYDFTNENDTLINGSLYKHYTMKYHKLRESKRYKSGVAHYIVENNTEFHKPLCFLSYSFDDHKTSKKFPNGIANEIFTTSYDKKSLNYIFKLIQYVKINKYFLLPENCDTSVLMPLKVRVN